MAFVCTSKSFGRYAKYPSFYLKPKCIIHTDVCVCSATRELHFPEKQKKKTIFVQKCQFVKNITIKNPLNIDVCACSATLELHFPEKQRKKTIFVQKSQLVKYNKPPNPSSTYSWSISHIVKHEFFCLSNF